MQNFSLTELNNELIIGKSLDIPAEEIIERFIKNHSLGLDDCEILEDLIKELKNKVVRETLLDSIYKIKFLLNLDTDNY